MTSVIDLLSESPVNASKKRKIGFVGIDENEATPMDIDEQQDDYGEYEEGEGGEEEEEEESELLEPYMRKAVKRLFNHIDNNHYTKAQITEAVLNYCYEYPKNKNANDIVKNVQEILQTKDQLLQVIDLNHNSTAATAATAATDLTDNADIVIAPNQADPDGIEVIPNKNNKSDPVLEVLRILPDAKRSYVTQLLADHGNNSLQVLNLMMENGYEKDETRKNFEGSFFKKRKLEEKYDFKSKSWETSETYRNDAIIELGYLFPFISPSVIPKIFAINGFHYYHTLQYIEEKTGEKARYTDAPVLLPFRYCKEKYQEITSRLKQQGLQNTIRTRQLLRTMPERKFRDELDEVLALEIDSIKRQQQTQLMEEDLKIAERINQEIAKEEHATFECQCCYDDEYAFEEMVQCTEGDLFCKSCLKRTLEEMLFGKGRLTSTNKSKAADGTITEGGGPSSMTIPCMNSANSCPGFFTEYMIEKVLPEKVFEKYTETLMQENIEKAQLTENMITCHECGLMYEKPSNDVAMTAFQCIACNAKTCLLCGLESHVPLKCAEVEKKEETAKRLSLEEAMAEARIRECPKCHKRFYKTEGCNKMTCACGTLSCYLCRKDLSKIGYQHFCQTPHCDHKNCGKCVLYSNSVEDDRRAMLEAALKTLYTDGNSDSKEQDPDPVKRMMNLDPEQKAELEKLMEGGLKGLDKKPINTNNMGGGGAIGAIGGMPANLAIPQGLPRIAGMVPNRNPIPQYPLMPQPPQNGYGFPIYQNYIRPVVNQLFPAGFLVPFAPAAAPAPAPAAVPALPPFQPLPINAAAPVVPPPPVQPIQPIQPMQPVQAIRLPPRRTRKRRN